MTTSPISECNENGSPTAGPWTHRSLELGGKILEDLRVAKVNKRVADAAEKQAMATFKHAAAEGIMDGYFNDLSEGLPGQELASLCHPLLAIQRRATRSASECDEREKMVLLSPPSAIATESRSLIEIRVYGIPAPQGSRQFLDGADYANHPRLSGPGDQRWAMHHARRMQARLFQFRLNWTSRFIFLGLKATTAPAGTLTS